MQRSAKRAFCSAATAAVLISAGVARENGRCGPRDGWRKLDNDGDGRLSETEFNQAAFARDFNASAFSIADTNADNYVDSAEFHAFMCQARFSMLDTDNDGRLSAAELNAEKGPFRPTLEEMDTDNDGFVSLKEFKAFRPVRPAPQPSAAEE